MTDPNPSPSPNRETLARLMRSSGHDGMLLMRTSGGSDAALDLPCPGGTAVAAPAPVPTRREIQITGIRKHFAECVTEQDDGEMCDARSSDWDSPMPANAWIRAHADEKGHTKFVKLMEESVSAFAKNAGGPRGGRTV